MSAGSRGSHQPLEHCDDECEAANECSGKGGERCAGCGLYFCSIWLNADNLCETCAAEREEEERLERQEAEGEE